MSVSDDSKSKFVVVSITIRKNDSTAIELVPDHVDKILHYWGMKEHKIVYDCDELTNWFIGNVG